MLKQIVLLLVFLVFAGNAYAACTNPVADEGVQIYNSTVKSMQFCNGTDWINLKSIEAAVPNTATAGESCGILGRMTVSVDNTTMLACLVSGGNQIWVAL